jgi:UDP-GlcNAc:undecaprenyl-phosphate GlcNAc-1-phosphate transferase
MSDMRLPEEVASAAAQVWPVLAAMAFAASAAISLALTPVAERLGRHLGMMDAPTLPRKLHANPTPRSGGLAVAMAFYGTLALGLVGGGLVLPVIPGVGNLVEQGASRLLSNLPEVMAPVGAILLGGLCLFVLGAADDRRPLSPRLKLFVQIAVAVGLWLAGVDARLGLPPALGLAITVVWVITICNAINFLDNMNGLSSGVVMLVAMAFMWQSWTSGEWLMMATWATLAGSTAGFWWWNFRTGTPFLGDGGALFLGFMLAALALRATWYQPGIPSALPALTPIILLGVPIFDTATVMFIRLREGRPLMVGDRCHLSHRLVALGFSHRDAVVFHYVLCGALGLLAWPLRFLPPGPALSLVGAVALLFVLIFLLEQTAASLRAEAPTPTPPTAV